MSKIPIIPQALPLGLGEVDSISITINYKVGEESTTLEINYFRGSFPVTVINPKLVPVPPEVMQEWNINLGQVVGWVCDQIGAQLVTENQS
jgi:hypothetical protein